MGIQIRGIVGLIAVAGALIGMSAVSSDVFAARTSSTSYIIDASVNDTFGGAQGSGSYKLISSGGESIIGDGSSGSYKLSAGYIAQLTEEESANFIEVGVQPSGLVAYYPLNEVNGTAVDDKSPNTNDGTLENSPSWSTGKLDGGLSFTASGQDSVSVPDSNNFSQHSTLTISLWANQTAANADQGLLSHWHQGNSTSWALQTASSDASKLRFYVASSTGDTGGNYVDSTTGAWSSGGWNHIIIVYDGSLANAERVKMFVNGAPVATTTTGTINTALVNADAPLKIGDIYGLNRYWDGTIDHVKLFSRALNPAEISAEYNAQNSGIESGLSLGEIIPGSSNSSSFDVITETDAAAYSLAIEQNHDLQNGAETVTGVSGSIETPAAWSEGTTTGLGFSLGATNATAIPAKWNSGASYAAIPGTSTTFYNRTGTPSSKDILSVNLRIDAPGGQAPGNYSQTTSIIGTTSL